MEMNKQVEELLQAPLLIAAVKDEKILAALNNALPYSTGFEIEGNYSDLFNVGNFTSIPYIVHVDCSPYEQRFRIPNGIRGIICLYLISRQLRVNCALNPDSGIHYHVDCTDVNFDSMMGATVRKQAYVISELWSWGYRRYYNSKGVGTSHYWVRFNDLHTLEFRIGEMTFDYSLLLKRIMHANAIVKAIKQELEDYKEPTFEPCNFKVIFEHLKMPYTLGSFNKDSYLGKIANIQKQIEKLDQKPPEEIINPRKRRHIL